VSTSHSCPAGGHNHISKSHFLAVTHPHHSTTSENNAHITTVHSPRLPNLSKVANRVAEDSYRRRPAYRAINSDRFECPEWFLSASLTNCYQNIVLVVCMMCRFAELLCEETHRGNIRLENTCDDISNWLRSV
jgi:hypothetical protein